MARNAAGVALLLVPVYGLVGLSFALRDFDIGDNVKYTLVAGLLGGAVLIGGGLALGTVRQPQGWLVTGIGVALPPATWFIAQAIW